MIMIACKVINQKKLAKPYQKRLFLFSMKKKLGSGFSPANA